MLEMMSDWQLFRVIFLITQRTCCACKYENLQGLSKKSHENQKLRILQTQNAAKAA
jgi:hypothetical protein